MYLGDFPVIMSWIVLCAVVRLQPGQLLAVAGVRQKGWHPLQNIPDMWMSAMESAVTGKECQEVTSVVYNLQESHRPQGIYSLKRSLKKIVNLMQGLML